MSIFTSILDKLGIHRPVPPDAKGSSVPPSQPGPMSVPRSQTPSYGATPQMPMVDVVSKLDGMAAKNPEKLDWRVSIVDLLKLLGMEATGAAIKELAVELQCPESEMGDSYKRNVWLHKALLTKIAENGGNIPRNLLN